MYITDRTELLEKDFDRHFVHSLFRESFDLYRIVTYLYVIQFKNCNILMRLISYVKNKCINDKSTKCIEYKNKLLFISDVLQHFFNVDIAFFDYQLCTLSVPDGELQNRRSVVKVVASVIVYNV